MKIIDKSQLNQKELRMLVSELAIVRTLNHNNVVKCAEVVESRTHVYVVMENVPGGELYNLLRKRKYFSEFESCYVTYHLLVVLKYLHSIGVIHRDLKPENILLVLNGKKDRIASLKLSDFGLACMCLSESGTKENCGTPSYVAPEVIRRAPYGPSADMWSLGVVVYLLYSRPQLLPPIGSEGTCPSRT